MKKFLLLLLTLLCAGAVHVRAGAIEDIVDLLHQAKDSPTPLPLLHKAKAEFSKFQAAKKAGGGLGGRAKAGAKKGASEMKERGEEAIDRAIEAANSGSADLGSKIDAAVAEVHHTETLAH